MEAERKALVTAMSIKMNVEIITDGHALLRGKLHSQYLETPFEFFDLVRLLEKMDEIFNTKGFPEAFLKPRSFVNDKDRVKNGKAEKQDTMNDSFNPLLSQESGNTKCTFEISVRFRQNATWQGQIYWVEQNKRQNFRSVLEMLKLMDEALTDGDEKTVQVEWIDGAGTV